MSCHHCCHPDPPPTELQRIRLALLDMHHDIREMKEVVHAMADQSALLNSVAEGLRTLGATVAALLAENAGLRTRNAELEGEEVAESAATTNVVAEYDALAGLFTAEPSVPDVEPLPPVEEPEPEVPADEA